MKDNHLHLYFHSNLDDPDLWCTALTRLLGPLRFSAGPQCSEPETVDVALLWTSPPQGLAAFSQLRAVLSLGAGINQLDLSSLARGVPVARLVDDSLTGTMVEYARATVMRYHRSLHRYEQDARERRWHFRPPVPAGQRRIGILGLGQLGLAVAQALAADGFRVLGWSSSAKTQAGLESFSGEQGLADLAGQVDILINVLPLTPATRGILDRALFARFGHPVQLINMGRGEHLVESDLLAALKAGWVEAATLDVTCIEPLPEESMLWEHPDILITPHVAGLSSPDSAAECVAQNIGLALQGRPLINQVDFTKGY